jgi:putative endonuclease
MSAFAYIVANRKYGTLYVGSTSDLVERSLQHKGGCFDGFTKKYGIKTLVYFEVFGTLEEARVQEWRMKHWKREWKINRIESMNPSWEDVTPK